MIFEGTVGFKRDQGDRQMTVLFMCTGTRPDLAWPRHNKPV
jgi:hypothetical protein